MAADVATTEPSRMAGTAAERPARLASATAERPAELAGTAAERSAGRPARLAAGRLGARNKARIMADRTPVTR
jgi:hypothetical protein